MACARLTFFVPGLAPNVARISISIRFWLRAPPAALAPRILAHIDDLRVVLRFDRYGKLFRGQMRTPRLRGRPSLGIHVSRREARFRSSSNCSARV